MYGGENTWSGLGWLVLVAVLLLLLVLWLIPGNQLGTEFLDPSVTDYDCDIRIGCDGRNLTAREITNIELERALEREAETARQYRMEHEPFAQTNYQPGVDRPQIPQLLDSSRLRTEDLMEGLTGRSHSDFVFTQFGNDGTVINPNVNPLFRPRLSTGGSEANLMPAARARAANA